MINLAVRTTVDRRRFLLGAGLLAGLTILTVGVTRAVVVTGPSLFEIQDGNVTDEASPTTPDWDTLFGTNSSAGPPPGPVSLVSPIPGGGAASQFTVDPLAFDPLVGQEPIA